MRAIGTSLVLTISVVMAGADAVGLNGKAVSIQSGDTLTVRQGIRRYRLHVAGVKAPQRREQGFGESRESLSELCLKRRVRLWLEAGKREAVVWCRTAGGYFADAAYYQLNQGMADLQMASSIPRSKAPWPRRGCNAWVCGTGNRYLAGRGRVPVRAPAGKGCPWASSSTG